MTQINTKRNDEVPRPAPMPTAASYTVKPEPTNKPAARLPKVTIKTEKTDEFRQVRATPLKPSNTGHKEIGKGWKNTWAKSPVSSFKEKVSNDAIKLSSGSISKPLTRDESTQLDSIVTFCETKKLDFEKVYTLGNKITAKTPMARILCFGLAALLLSEQNSKEFPDVASVIKRIEGSSNVLTVSFSEQTNTELFEYFTTQNKFAFYKNIDFKNPIARAVLFHEITHIVQDLKKTQEKPLKLEFDANEQAAIYLLKEHHLLDEKDPKKAYEGIKTLFKGEDIYRHSPLFYAAFSVYEQKHHLGNEHLKRFETAVLFYHLIYRFYAKNLVNLTSDTNNLLTTHLRTAGKGSYKPYIDAKEREYKQDRYQLKEWIKTKNERFSNTDLEPLIKKVSEIFKSWMMMKALIDLQAQREKDPKALMEGRLRTVLAGPIEAFEPVFKDVYLPYSLFDSNPSTMNGL